MFFAHRGHDTILNLIADVGSRHVVPELFLNLGREIERANTALDSSRKRLQQALLEFHKEMRIVAGYHVRHPIMLISPLSQTFPTLMDSLEREPVF
jgi:hypothetical protein